MTDELAQQISESSGPAAGGGATVIPETVRTTASDPDLTDSSLYFNRELSWLDFNDRVLQLAEDPRVPLLERVKFCAIFESNLDEFFMVRVAGLQDQVEAGIDARGADGLARRRSDRPDPRAGRRASARASVAASSDELRPALAEHGIRIISLDDANAGEREEVDRTLQRAGLPGPDALVIGRGRPFPYISNLSLSLAVLLRNPDQDDRGRRPGQGAEGAAAPVPLDRRRPHLRPARGRDRRQPRFLFPGMEIVHHSLFRVTRDTDYDVSDEADDLLQAVEEEVRRRRFGEVVRLEVDPDMEPRLRDQLVEAMRSSDARSTRRRACSASTTSGTCRCAGSASCAIRRSTAVTPAALLQGRTQREVDVFAAIRQGDILVHHPYDSFTGSVERFVRQAVEDPNVLAIKQTVYRTSADSPLVPALIEAAERGKQAVCLVELKARFDESANIPGRRRWRRPACTSSTGSPALKTHVKCILVARREGDGVRLRPHRHRQLQPEDGQPLHRLRPLHDGPRDR